MDKSGLKCDLAVGVIFLFGLQSAGGSIIHLNGRPVTSASASFARLCILQHVYHVIILAMYI